MAGRGTDIQLGGNARYGLMDWLKAEIAGGELAGAASDDQLVEWIDDSLRDGDEWIDNRLKERIAEMGERSLREWTAEEAKAGRQPAPKDVEKRRARIQAELRDPDQGGASRARRSPRSTSSPRSMQPSIAPRRAAMTSASSAGSATVWRLMRGRDWLDKDGHEWSLQRAGDRFQHYVNLALRQWLEEQVAGRAAPAAGGGGGATRPAAGDARADRGQVRRDAGRRGREEAEGAGVGRSLRARHRAAREPAHRQPAARPLWPPGRSRPLQVLPVPRRRPDAHLRLRPHGRHAAEAGPAGRRGHHASLDQQGAGEGAAEGRGAQLQFAQARAQVRRRDERSAQGDLRAPHRHHGARRRERHRHRPAPAGGAGAGGRVHPAQRLRRAVELGEAEGGDRSHLRPRSAHRQVGRRGRHRRRGDHASGC